MTRKHTNSRIGCAGFSLAFLALAQTGGHAADAYPKPNNLGDPAKLGLGIQRTMTLLATSTPKHRNTVRILFYGQSITEQPWTRMVADDLKRRFPNANLIIENRALGGYASQLLVNTSETDLYPFYPDLMIFQVYGSHIEYENIIRRTRERTTAEILIQTDHVNNDADLTEETDPAKLRPDGKIWNSFFNYLFLPTIVKRYNTGMEDRRNLWKQYLRDNHLHAQELLQDGVHPNAFGNYLMAALDGAYLVYRKDAHIDPMHCDTVKTFAVGADLKRQNGKLKLEFDGNRVDIVAGKGGGGPAQILIDGKKPSEIPELYGFTRALPTPGGKWPAITRLASKSLLQEEDWILDAAKDPSNNKVYTFSITGSKTGEDGSGRSDRAFVSKSGRIVIEPAWWGVEYALMLPGVKPVPDRFQIRWKSVSHGLDVFTAPEPSDPTVERIVTVAQGLAPGKHTLEIVGSAPDAVAAVRIYCPPLKPGTEP